MTATASRITGGTRSASSAMAVPAPMSAMCQPHVPLRTAAPLGTSWPYAASPPSNFVAAYPHHFLTPHSLPTSGAGLSMRGELLIAHSSAATSRASAGGTAAISLGAGDQPTCPAVAPRRIGRAAAQPTTHAASRPSAGCRPTPSAVVPCAHGDRTAATAAAASAASAACAFGLPRETRDSGDGSHAPSSSGSGSGSGPAGASRRWPAPDRTRVRAAALATSSSNAGASSPPPRSAGSAAGGAGAGPGGGGGGTTTSATATAAAAATASAGVVAPRPPSPSLGITISYFEGFCPEGATECSPVWEQLRWCSKWQQMRQVYDNLMRAEMAAAAATSATAAQVAAMAAAVAAAAGDRLADSPPGSPTSSIDVADISSLSGGGAASPSSSLDRPPSVATTALGGMPGMLSRDETYAFLLQLQDFYHLRLDQEELEELQAFRCRLVRDLSVYVKQLNAEQLEALCCASAVSGKCLTRDRADAVQQRLLKILASTSSAAASSHGNGGANGTGTSTGTGDWNGHGNARNGNGNGNGNGSGAAAGGRRRPAFVGGFQVLTPALNTIFALYDHGYLPQVELLQAVFRQAVDHCGEVTRSQWHGLHGLARKFRFLLDDLWLEDLHAYLREPLSCAATDFGQLASILGCISAFTVNKAMEALDTRVLVVVEAIERRYDEGRSLLTAHQLCVFTALLVDMQSPFRSKWLRICLDHLGSCRSHLAGLPPATLVLAVELVIRGRGWDEQRLLSKLLRQLFSTYARHPTTALRVTPSNVSGCPPRAASRIIAPAASPSSSSSLPFAASSTAPSLSAMAAAASWDVDVGGAGGAASPALDLASLVNWLASKVPSDPGPERADTLEFLQPLVSGLVESGRGQLAALDPRCLPGLIRAVALLSYSPSREWVAEAFTHVAGGAAALSGGELVAMLRLSHTQGLPLPHATLDAVCAQHARILPLMRAVDLQRLLECWVADRYIPSREQLEGFFDAVCEAFEIDLLALKLAAVGTPPDSAVRSIDGAAGDSFDSDAASLPWADATRRDRNASSGGELGGGGGAGSSSGSAGRTTRASHMELEMLQAAGGAVSAGAADGVTGRAAAAGRSSAPPPPPSVDAAVAPGGRGTGKGGGAAAATAGAAGAVAAATTASAATTTSSAASVAVAADAAAAAAAAAATGQASASADGYPYKTPSLGSLDGRPRGSLLQPEEAQSMLTLLDQYRALLLAAKRSDLLVVMNTYRNAVTASLHEMRKAQGGARKPASSRLLQAVLRGGEAGGGVGSGSKLARRQHY